MTYKELKFVVFCRQHCDRPGDLRDEKFQKLRNNVLKITNMAKMLNLEVDRQVSDMIKLYGGSVGKRGK